MNLKLGKMTTKELAEWMGIKYGSFRNNTEKRYKILEQYCKFKRVYGGIEVEEIYVSTYSGDLESHDIRVYLEEVRQAPNHLVSISGITRKAQHEREEYQDIAFNTARNRFSKAGLHSFGKTNFQEDRCAYSGPYGYREYVWAVKISDMNEYRYMSEEEEKYFDKTLEYFFQLPAEKIKTMALLDEALKNGELDIQEYFNKKENLGLDSFKEVINKMLNDCGILIVRCTRHEITKEPRESIF